MRGKLQNGDVVEWRQPTVVQRGGPDGLGQFDTEIPVGDPIWTVNGVQVSEEEARAVMAAHSRISAHPQAT